MSTPKSAVQADLSAIIDGMDNDATDVLNPLLETRGFIRAGRMSVSATDTHVKPLAEALAAVPPLALAINDAGADETLALTLDEAALVTPDDAQSLANKTLVAAVIASFLNAQHGHANAAGGGQLNAATAFGGGTFPTARLPALAAGQAGILPAPDISDNDNVLKGDGTWGDPASGGSGTVTSVGLIIGGDVLNVAGSPLTQDGAFVVTKATQPANRVYGAPNGSNGAPAFRALAKNDLPALASADLTDVGMVEIVPWTVLGSNAASIAISSIPATYGALLLVVKGRGTHTAAGVGFGLRFNGDSGSNYRMAQALLQASLVTTDATGSDTTVGVMPANSATSGYFGLNNIWLPGYAVTGRPRTVFSRAAYAPSGTAGAMHTRPLVGYWTNTAAAINAITLLPVAGNFVAGTGYALYGLK